MQTELAALVKDGKLPAYAWPGGYPILYLFSNGEVCCPSCASGENGSEARIDSDDMLAVDDWTLVGYFVHYEGPGEYCAHCNAVTDSAYGDPEKER